jgi:hypothetical protein
MAATTQQTQQARNARQRALRARRERELLESRRVHNRMATESASRRSAEIRAAVARSNRTVARAVSSLRNAGVIR